MAIFENQSYLRLIVNTGMNLSSATSAKINYRKPSGASGNWVADQMDGKNIIYNIKNGDLDEDGTWSVQAYVDIDSRVALGSVHKIKVLPQI